MTALLTCHNRREATLSCLCSLFTGSENSLGGVLLDAVLVDDGSTDGTAAAVAAAFPTVEVVVGSGDLFWCRGMELAWRTARHRGRIEVPPIDAFLWVNDDVLLVPDAVDRLVATAESHRRQFGSTPIVVGSLEDPLDGGLTYGGYRRGSDWHPGRLDRVEPDSDEAIRIDTFNGNIVLVPALVSDEIGIIDGRFSHATGDVDYGLRAGAAGIDIVLATGFHGTCTRNPPDSGGVRSKLQRKGLPWRDWLIYTRRHGGRWRWPVAFISPYVGAAVVSLKRRLGRG